jgi:hypothetical protein
LRNESVLRSSRSSSGVLGAPEELLCGLGIKAVVCKLKEDYQQCFTGREDLRDGQSLFLRDECLRTWHSGRRGRAPGIINERAVHLANVKGPHRSAHYYEEYDVRYCVLATLYHLNRLIDLYVELCQLFEHIPPGTAIHGNTSDPRVFYEIDAFLGAARRVYESIRKVLWKHYHNPKEASR